MSRAKPRWPDLLMGQHPRQRMRVSQSLLGVPALLMIDAALLAAWRLGHLPGASVAWFALLTLAGCVVFYALVRSGLGERLSAEASLSMPQMVYAMCCVALGYALAGPLRAGMLCLMPLILSFGIFALPSRAAGRLAGFGIVLMGLAMAGLALDDPLAHHPVQEAMNWCFVAISMAMTRVLAERLGRMRTRLSDQKAELSAALERIRQLATLDALTGLLNRRAAQDRLRQAADRAARERRPMVVALADLDHFKLINDSFGHPTGDRVLQAFAQVARREVRAPGQVARWGGEEFLFMLPGLDEREACELLERLRQGYAATAVEGLPAAVRPGFSAGVTRCHGPSDIEAAIDRADRAMYSAKVAGRNRTRRPAPATDRVPAGA